MERIYTVKTTSQAEEQIQEIIHYVAYELKAPDAALHLLDARSSVSNSDSNSASCALA